MGTITKIVLQCMERFRKQQVKLDGLTHPVQEDAADYILERDKKYCRTEMRVMAVIKSHKVDEAAALTPPTCGELMEWRDIVRRKM